MSLKVGCVVQATQTGLDNDQFQIDQALLGVITGVDAGTMGSFFFDQFESFSN